MYRAQLYERIADVPIKEWDSVAKDHAYIYSHKFLEAMEASNIGECRYMYVMIYDASDRLVALTYFNSTRTDLAIFASGGLRSALVKIRKLFPNFLKMKILECQTPIQSKNSQITDLQRFDKEIIQFLGETLLEIARKQRQFLVVMGAFEPKDHPHELPLKNLGYHFEPCLPVAYLDILWDSPARYLAAMKSYYRSKLQRHLRINQSNDIRHELRDNFEDLAEVLWQQWLVVHEHAVEYSGETLTPEFYRNISVKFGAQSKVLLIYSGDDLIGHALLLQDGDTLHWRNFGRAKATNDSLYIYTCHKVIETAISLGAKRLDLGVTTYAIKRDFGSSILSRKIALRLPSELFNRYLPSVYPLLNHIPEFSGKEIFKK